MSGTPIGCREPRSRRHPDVQASGFCLENAFWLSILSGLSPKFGFIQQEQADFARSSSFDDGQPARGVLRRGCVNGAPECLLLLTVAYEFLMATISAPSTEPVFAVTNYNA